MSIRIKKDVEYPVIRTNKIEDQLGVVVFESEEIIERVVEFTCDEESEISQKVEELTSSGWALSENYTPEYTLALPKGFYTVKLKLVKVS